MLLWDKGEKSLNEIIMFFKKNDIVRLKEEYFNKIKSKFFFPQNVFFIDKYSENGNSVFHRNIGVLRPKLMDCLYDKDGNLVMENN